MRKALIFALLWLCIIATSHSVTFNVTVPAGTKECYVTGAFCNWDLGAAAQLNKVDDTHYSLNLPDVTDVSEGFKYLCGLSWDYVEKDANGAEVVNRTEATANDVVASWANIYNPIPVEENPFGLFTVTVPANTKKCYVVGTFNAWDISKAVEMETEDGIHYRLDMQGNMGVEPAELEFKYVNGPSWDYVELDNNGGSVNNRKKATTDDIVYRWSAVYNPDITSTTINFMSTEREIRVLTPPDYRTNTEKRYPVLYMQGVKQRYSNSGADGTNGEDLFGDTSWAVAKSMEQMAKAGKEVGIVVIMYGFINELSPWTNDNFMGSGQGDEYLKEYLEKVIPMINSQYRTLADAENTAIAGADMGGLISLYAALQYPETFGKVGLFSPSFWFNKPELASYLSAWSKSAAQKMYFAIGGKEPTTIKNDATEVYQQLSEKGFGAEDLILGIYPDGIHDDISWSKQFANVYSFLLGQAYEEASPEYRFMGDNGSGQAVCDGEAPFDRCTYYASGVGASEEVMAYVKVIPANVQSKYYWNVNVGKDCEGENLKSEDQNVGFSNKKTTDSWHRIIIREDKTMDVVSASCKHFKVYKAESPNAITMTRCKADGTSGEDESFTLVAEVDFGANKHFEIRYGSVNSGSDMGSLVGNKAAYPLEVPANCTKAQIIFNFTTNAVTVKPITTEVVNYDYLFMSGTTEVACDEMASFEDVAYYPAYQEVARQAKVYIQEVPVNEQGDYYWNINIGSECTGNTFFADNKKVGFSNKKTTVSWIRAVVYDDQSSENVALSSKHFKLIAGDSELLMEAEGGDYVLSATADFPTSDKSFAIKFGSVNSGSTMTDALTGGSVPENCLKAKITYSFKTNQATVETLAEGAPQEEESNTPVITYFRATPSFCKAGTPVTVSTLVKADKGYTFSYKVSHNYQTATPQNYTINAEGEMEFQIPNPTVGIYHITLSAQKGTEKADDITICVKVPYDSDRQDKEPNIIVNAYEEVNWETTGMYKANFHTHTSQSFDTSIPTNEVVDHYYAKGYKILALTDHDYNPYPWTMFSMFNPMAEDKDPSKLDIIAFPSIELSKDNRNNWNTVDGYQFNHHNDFFTGRKGQEFATLHESYAYTQKLGGLQIINHPGQYWNLNNKYNEDITQTNSPAWHANNFKTYESLIGLEVYNQGNRRPNDRILWDQILDRTMPERPVYGYSCDDAHNLDQYFHNYEFMLMEELSLPALKDAMRKGKLFFSYEYENSGDAKAPMINKIQVDEVNQTISIDTPSDKVYWISSTDIKDPDTPGTRKSTVVGYGKSFFYKGFQGKYVRALITNKYGETCTQPFGFKSDGTSIDALEEDKQENDFIICPNPANNYTSVISDSEIEEIELVSMGGQIMRKYSGNNKTTAELDIQGLNSGIYILKVRSNSFTKSKLLNVLN